MAVSSTGKVTSYRQSIDMEAALKPVFTLWPKKLFHSQLAYKFIALYSCGGFVGVFFFFFFLCCCFVLF